jgi:hypothetical protein
MLCRKQYHKVTINNETGVFAYQSEKVETKNLKLNCENLQIDWLLPYFWEQHHMEEMNGVLCS